MRLAALFELNKCSLTVGPFSAMTEVDVVGAKRRDTPDTLPVVHFACHIRTLGVKMELRNE